MEIGIQLPDISGKIKEAVSKEIKQHPCRSNYASRLGHPCLRYLTHCRLDWEKVPPISVEKKMLFDGGKVIEQHIAKVYLEKAGYDIVEQDRPAGWEEKQIGGYLDFIIRGKGLPGEVPVEVKSMEHHTWQKIESIEDLLFSKKTWHKTYPGQLTTYMLQKNKEMGLFLNISKLTYEPKHIWVGLDYTYAEELIQKAEKVNAHVANKTYPNRIEYDPNVCDRCDFKFLCLQEVRHDGAEIIDNEALEGKLERREHLKSFVSEYKEIDDEVKQTFKERPQVIVGTSWQITGKWVPKTIYEIPEEVKAKYATQDKYWQTKIVKI